MNPRKAFAHFAQGRDFGGRDFGGHDFGGREFGRGRHWGGCSPMEKLQYVAEEAREFFGRGGFGPHGFGPQGFGGWGGFGGADEGMERGGRTRSGRVRSTLLKLLAEEPQTGYQLMQAYAEKTNGFWAPGPETIYPVLQQLEDEGLIQAESNDGQKRYALTEAGQGAAQELAGNEGSAPWDRGEASTARQLFRQAHQLKGAMMALRHASEAQQQQAGALLEQTRRALYQILAQADETQQQTAPEAEAPGAETEA